MNRLPDITKIIRDVARRQEESLLIPYDRSDEQRESTNKDTEDTTDAWKREEQNGENLF